MLIIMFLYSNFSGHSLLTFAPVASGQRLSTLRPSTSVADLGVLQVNHQNSHRNGKHLDTSLRFELFYMESLNLCDVVQVFNIVFSTFRCGCILRPCGLFLGPAVDGDRGEREARLLLLLRGSNRLPRTFIPLSHALLQQE